MSEMPWEVPCTEAVACPKEGNSVAATRVHLDSHRTSSMVKATSRLLKHHAQPSLRSHRNFVTSSNTSKGVRKVFTPSASSSSPVKQQSQPEEDLLDGGHPIIVDDLDGTPADIDYPANISVRTKAKRYQNSV